jgi:hypothetical protein
MHLCLAKRAPLEIDVIHPHPSNESLNIKTLLRESLRRPGGVLTEARPGVIRTEVTSSIDPCDSTVDASKLGKAFSRASR